jgi:hypothetical protein
MGVLKLLFLAGLELVFAPILVVVACLGRLRTKEIDVGLGPEPLINNIYHKRALVRHGYTAETFVNAVYFITTQFDVRGDHLLPWLRYNLLRLHLISMVLAVRVLWRYRTIYISFNGGPLGAVMVWLWRFEPTLLRLGRVRTLILPYGSDVQDMQLSSNFTFKHAKSMDYPGERRRIARVKRQVRLWTVRADHIIGGCEWVDYMGHWDTLMLAHFSIDTEWWSSDEPSTETDPSRPFRIIHAPNHRAIKGTQYFITAVEELRAEGLAVELVLLEKVPNDRIRDTIRAADAVADQLVVGWYAMFALEGMAMRKPVFCFLRPDLKELYTRAGLIRRGEIPIVDCAPETVKDAIRDLMQRRTEIPALGQRSRDFVLRHHSLEAVGATFARINRVLGVEPRPAQNSRG